VPLNPDIELQEHQKRVRQQAEQAAASGDPYRVLLNWGTGSGKSFGALGIADALGGPATIIGPAALRNTLKAESQRLLGHNNYPVYSYNAAARGKVPDAQTLIVDESQRLGSPSSAQARAVQDLASRAKNVVMMSATPVRNNPAEFAPLLSILKNQPISHEEFAKKYVGNEETKPGIIGRILGRPTLTRPALVNTDELKRQLAGHVDVFNPETPPVNVTNERINVEMPRRQAELYRGLIGKLPWVIRQKLKMHYPLTDSEMMKAKSFLSGARQSALSELPYQGRENPLKAFNRSGKLTTAYGEMQKTLADPRTKGIVYSNFIGAGLKPYAAALERDKIPHGIFHGGLSDQERKALVDKFNQDKLRVALVAPAGSEGISLKGVQNTQLLDEYWNAARNTQAKARGIRFDSHTHLPEDLRNVKVQQFAAKLPLTLKDKLLSRMGVNRDRSKETVDDYLEHMSQKKDELNNQLMDVLAQASRNKGAALIAHIGGVSGAGKTTVLSQLRKTYPTVITKDIDEFDEDAKKKLGLPYAIKGPLTDDVLSALTNEKQRLLSKFLSTNVKKPVVTGGIHFEQRGGGYALDLPATHKLMLDTSPLRGSWRAYHRARRSTEPNYTLGEIIRHWYENKHIQRDYKDMGYEIVPPQTVIARVGDALKTAATAVIVKGNPKFIANNPHADSFYKKLENLLSMSGYEVSTDPGEPLTEPAAADLWLGHSRGADRLRFAPAGTKTVAVGSSISGAINHPEDDVHTPFHQTGQLPPEAHYKLTPEMTTAIGSAIKRASITTQDIVIFQKLSQIVPTLGITENIIATPSGVYPDIVLLKDAKRYSDMGDYDKKTEILRNMMTKRPMDWTVDSHQPHTVGLTHRTGFKFHMPRKNVIDLMPTADPLHGLNLDV